MKVTLEISALLVTLLLTVATAATPQQTATSNQTRSASVRNEVECRMGSDGTQTCGYNCMMGSDGRYACANTPGGKCAMGSNGRVTCSEVAIESSSSSVEAERRMSTNGTQVCGYNCKMGSDGRYACADTPDGKCAMGSNGRVTCSRLAR